MRVGLKLDIGFSTDPIYRELFGDRDALRFLRELGVKAVETPVDPGTDPGALRDHVRRSIAAGFRLSLHPYTEGTPADIALFAPGADGLCRDAAERFFVLADEAARLQQAPTLVNLHPAAGPLDAPRRELLERSVRFFEWALAWCPEHAPCARPVAELQIRPDPGEPVQRIGDDYRELLEIVRRSGVEACWDLGHAVMNARRFGLPLDPPAELRKRVVHVHCHDVDRADHRPLVFGNVPLERFLGDLLADGYRGSVILEVAPRAFLRAGGLDALVRSVRALRGITGEGPLGS